LKNINNRCRIRRAIGRSSQNSPDAALCGLKFSYVA
jgi:hypothetical protein